MSTRAHSTIRALCVPTILHAAVARTDGPSSEITWDGRQLLYRAWRGNATIPPSCVPLSPSAADWAHLWRALDDADAWSWHGRYDDDSAEPSGPGWVLTIASRRGAIDASGIGRVPHGDRVAFRRVCRALSELAGGRPIG